MMFNPNNSEKPPSEVRNSWLRRNFLAIVMFLIILCVTIALFVFKEEIINLGNYGYLGIFLISVFTNATIILPMPSILLVIPLGATFNPLYIGLAAGIGGAIGEMTAYIAGYSGRRIWNDSPNYLKAVAWLKKWGMSVIFMFAALPMPIDIMGFAAGNLRLPAWRFFIPCWLGKTIKYIGLAYAGYLGWDAFNRNESLKTTLTVCGIAVVVVIILFVLALLLENWDWKRSRRK
jgi:membrane protein DedA with SNARE-associated domain